MVRKTGSSNTMDRPHVVSVSIEQPKYEQPEIFRPSLVAELTRRASYGRGCCESKRRVWPQVHAEESGRRFMRAASELWWTNALGPVVEKKAGGVTAGRMHCLRE